MSSVHSFIINFSQLAVQKSTILLELYQRKLTSIFHYYRTQLITIAKITLYLKIIGTTEPKF